MPFVEAWYALEGMGEAAAASEAIPAVVEGTTLAAEALPAAATAAELGGLGQIGGAAGAQLTPAIQSATAIGGEGAGGAGIQTAMQQAMQQAPTQFTGEAATQGITQAASPYSLTGPAPTVPNPAYSLPSPVTSAGEGLRAGTSEGIKAGSNALYQGYQPSALETGWDKFTQFADKHPFMTGSAAYMGAQKLGLLNPNSAQMPNTAYSGPLSKYRLSENFQPGPNLPNTNPYQSTYPSYAGGGIMDAQDGQVQQMASGGIAHYAKGNLTETLDFYKQMMEPSTASGASAPHSGGDAGIYYDLDPDTRYQDALTAAQIRQAKLNKRSNMQLPAASVTKRPTPMGSLNLRPPGVSAQAAQSSLDPENAAQGGIMQAHSTLGGYAAGGNPRLLKGPGDGMSDNIPATIAGKQPARLADGEFVVPADVVSHLGNGSTDAGAKKLHEMMTDVRKARTGNPKQGKQINPNKYMPK